MKSEGNLLITLMAQSPSFLVQCLGFIGFIWIEMLDSQETNVDRQTDRYTDVI